MSDFISIETINDRFKKLQAREQERLKRAYEVLSHSSKKVLDLLPLFLHLNHPLLPGFRHGNVPYGIDNFELTPYQEKFLHNIFKDKNFDIHVNECKILALYAMGSSASIGQGFRSDFDIWVCVKKDLPKEDLLLLMDKCNFFSIYAKSKGVDLNLFITPENRFKQGYHDSLDSDNCGSAQNLFLLDEFYRSSIRIAGRYLIWNIITTKEELTNYEGYKRQILATKGVDPNLWFDFGSVVKSSPAEYFGSGLWLLYKGIESPFKAVIKILLMEVYANEYPNTSLLSSELKDRMLNSDQNSLMLDPYIAMFKKVSDYLINIKDDSRLELTRKCFYLKIYLGLKGLKNSSVFNYRMSILKNFVEHFNWDIHKLHEIEERDRWKISFVRALNKQIFKTLITSYRSLLSFSIRHGIEYAITSDDAGVLSRKLYAAFDRYQGKILVFNQDLSKSLEEKDLTFIFPSESSICRHHWYLYACAKNDVNILSMPLAYSGESICEVIAWACFNKLLTLRTKNHVVGKEDIISDSKIKALASDIIRLVEPRFLRQNQLNLQRPREIVECLIILNFENDPTKLISLNKIDFEHGNSLSCGRQKYCLIGSINVVIVNSWGELLSIAIPDGEAGIVEMLAMLVRSTVTDKPLTKDNLRGIKVSSYASNYGELLRYDLEALIKKIFLSQEHNQEFLFEIGKSTYIASNADERGIIITRRNAFGQNDYNVSIFSKYGMKPEFALQVPALVDRYATFGVIQYFFIPVVNGWDIYVLNENNEVDIQKGYKGSRANLVNSINRYYTKQSEAELKKQIHFNLPQYFVLSADLKSIHPFTIKALTT